VIIKNTAQYVQNVTMNRTVRTAQNESAALQVYNKQTNRAAMVVLQLVIYASLVLGSFRLEPCSSLQLLSGRRSPSRMGSRAALTQMNSYDAIVDGENELSLQYSHRHQHLTACLAVVHSLQSTCTGRYSLSRPVATADICSRRRRRHLGEPIAIR